jgi:hypothetical protein
VYAKAEKIIERKFREEFLLSDDDQVNKLSGRRDVKVAA